MEIRPGITKWGGGYILNLNKDEIAELDREVNGVGGFQDLLRDLQGRVNHAVGTIKLTEDDLVHIPHVAFDYKQGGFEERLMKILGRLLGPNLGRDDARAEPPAP